MPAPRHDAERVEVVTGDRLEQPQLRTRRNDGDDVEQPPRRGSERRGAREHRVSHRDGEPGSPAAASISVT